MNPELDFLISLRLDSAEGFAKLEEQYKAFRKHAEGGFTVPIEAEMDTKEVEKKVKELAESFKDVTKQIETAEKEMQEFEKSIADAADELEKQIPGAFKRVKEAAKDGAEAARKEIEKIGKEINKATDPAKLTEFKKIAEQISSAWLSRRNARGGGAGMIGAATGGSRTKAHEELYELLRERSRREKEAREAQKNIKAMKEMGAEIPDELRKGLKDAIEDIKRFNEKLKEAFGGNVDLARKAEEAFTELRKEIKSGGTAPAKAPTDLSGLNKVVDALERLNALGNSLGGLKGKAGELSGQIFAHAQYATRPRPASGGSGGSAPLSGGGGSPLGHAGDYIARVVADPEHLVASINKILSEHIFTAKIGADMTFLANSLKASVETINRTGGIAANIQGATIAAAAAAGAAAVERAARVRQDTKKQQGPEIPPGFRIGMDGGLQMTRSEAERRRREANRTGPQIPEGHRVGPDGALTPTRSEAERQRKAMGPHPLPSWHPDRQAALAASWQSRYQTIMQGASTFGAGRADFGTDPLRNRWQEQTQAYLQYQGTVQRYEKAALALAQATTMEHQQDAYNQLEAAKRALEIQEHVLANATLLGRGSVRIGGRDMEKSTAFSFLQRGLSGRFGSDLAGINAGRGTDNQLNLSQMLRGLMANDKTITSEYLRRKNIAEELLRTERQRAEILDEEIKDIKEQIRLYGTLEDEVKQQVGLVNKSRGRGNLSAGYGNAIRNGFAIAGGIGIGYTAVNALRSQMRGYMDYQQEIAGIQGVLGSQNKDDANFIAGGIASSAAKYGVDLIETAKAARILAQSGMSATEVIKELDYTMMANKGMGMTVEQVQNLQVAIRAVTLENDKFNQSISWTVAVLEKVSKVEAAYAVESKDLADAITMLSPVVDQFSSGMNRLTDVFDQTIGMTTVIVEQLRITGNQAGNALKMMFSRLTRPEITGKLQNEFGAKMAGENGDLLPLDALLPTLGRRYQELKGSDPLKAKQFANVLAGGRQVHVITTLLENFVRQQDIAIESSYAWGGAQDRAAIATDTLHTAVGRAKNNFALFTTNLMDTSYAGKGLIAILNGIADAMGGVNGTGAGGLTAILGILGTGYAVRKGKSMYEGLSAARAAGAGGLEMLADMRASSGRRLGMMGRIGGLTKAGGFAGRAMGGLVSSAGALATIFTPGGVLIAGLAAATMAVGYLATKMSDADEKAKRYGVTIKSLAELKAYDSPQMKLFQSVAEERGYGTVEGAYEGIRKIVQSDKVSGMLAPTNWMDDKAFATERAFNPKKVQAFQREFAEYFISQLPEHARKGFDKVTSQVERIKMVSEMVGGAAFAANVQIANAINDIRDATNRMVADGVDGIKKLDAAARTTLISKAWGGMKDALFGDSLQSGVMLYDKKIPTYSRRSRAQAEDLLGILKDMPGFNTLATSEVGMEQMLAVMGGMPRGATTKGAILQNFIRQAGVQGSVVNQAVSAEMLRDTDPAKANELKAAVYGKEYVSIGETVSATWQESMNAVRDAVVKQASDALFEKLPGSHALKRADLWMRGQTGLDGQDLAADSASKAGWAISQFSDALLDMVATIYDKIRQMRTEEAFSRAHGMGYNKGNSLVDFGRFVLQAGDQFKGDRNMDIVKLRREMATVAARAVQSRSEDGTRLNRIGVEEEKVAKEIAQKKYDLERFASESLPRILGSSPEGQAAYADLKKQLAEILGEAVPQIERLDEWMQSIGQRAVTIGRQIINNNAAQLQQLDLHKEAIEKVGKMREASLPINATLLTKLQAQGRASADMYMAERAIIEAKMQQGNEDQAQLERDMRKLETQYEMNAVFDAYMAMREAEKALDEQRMTNMQGMMAGFKALVTNTSVWDAVYNPQGNTAEEKARAKAEAIKQIIFDTISPVFKTISDRMTENVFETLAENLLGNSILSSIADSPEMKLKTDLEGAKLYYEGIRMSSLFGASAIYQKMIEGGTFAANQIYMAMQGNAPSAIGAPGTIIGPDGAPSLPGASMDGMKKMQRNQLLAGMGMMVGNVGGAMVGKGGKGAQFGSNVGSVAGMIAGNMIVPGIGGMVGGAIGGILGGWLGGTTDKDKKAEQEGQIIALEAIERAQRETITAIQAQTDALLKPENRLMNLPSGFNVPSYNPGGAGGRVVNVEQITINVPVQTNANAAEIRDAVEEAVGNVLFDQRRSRGW